MKDILIPITRKQKLCKSHFLNGSNAQKIIYKKYDNKLTKIKFAAKTLYYKKEIEESTANPSKMWNMIKSLLPSNTNSPPAPDKIHVNNHVDTVTDAMRIVNIFNQYLQLW